MWQIVGGVVVALCAGWGLIMLHSILDLSNAIVRNTIFTHSRVKEVEREIAKLESNLSRDLEKRLAGIEEALSDIRGRLDDAISELSDLRSHSESVQDSLDALQPPECDDQA
jgi:hypothetical protein